MRPPSRLPDQVAWTSTPAPAWRRLIRSVPGLLELVLNLTTGGGTIQVGPEPTNPDVTQDPDAALGTVTVTGKSPSMPAAFPGPQVVTIYSHRATITPRFTEDELPLALMTIVHATPTGLRWTRRKDVDATWSIHALGDGIDLTFRGRWLLLAHLGTLGNWREPA
jgi:hypothetical protein